MRCVEHTIGHDQIKGPRGRGPQGWGLDCLPRRPSPFPDPPIAGPPKILSRRERGGGGGRMGGKSQRGRSLVVVVVLVDITLLVLVPVVGAPDLCVPGPLVALLAQLPRQAVCVHLPATRRPRGWGGRGGEGDGEAEGFREALPLPFPCTSRAPQRTLVPEAGDKGAGRGIKERRKGGGALAVVQDAVEGVPAGGGHVRRERPDVVPGHHVRVEEALQRQRRRQKRCSGQEGLSGEHLGRWSPLNPSRRNPLSPPVPSLCTDGPIIWEGGLMGNRKGGRGV